MGTRSDFFVSYNSADEQWAEWISHVLEDAGYSVVVQAWDFRPGSNFVLKMQKALRSSDRLVAVLSPDYLSARYPQPEWAAGFAADPEGADRKLVPVMVRPCEPTGLLGQIVQIRIYDLDDATATQRLLDGVRAGRGKPTTPPAFPGGAGRASDTAATNGDAVHSPSPVALPALVPRQLPTDLADFVERAGTTNELVASLREPSGAVVISALSGKGGIGKTTLAVHVARTVVNEFPDGQLYVNLRGVEGAAVAARPSDVLGEFLRALGVDGANIPVGARGTRGAVPHTTRRKADPRPARQCSRRSPGPSAPARRSGVCGHRDQPVPACFGRCTPALHGTHDRTGGGRPPPEHFGCRPGRRRTREGLRNRAALRAAPARGSDLRGSPGAVAEVAPVPLAVRSRGRACAVAKAKMLDGEVRVEGGDLRVAVLIAEVAPGDVPHPVALDHLVDDLHRVGVCLAVGRLLGEQARQLLRQVRRRIDGED